MSGEDLRFLVAHANLAKAYEPGGVSALLGPSAPTDLLAAESALAHVDVASLERANLAMAQAVDLAVAGLQGFAPAGVQTPALATAGDVFSTDTPYGMIFVSGLGANSHAQDAFVDIDLGGDDTYTSRAGGVRADVLGLEAEPIPPTPTDPGFPAWVDTTMRLLHLAHNASVVIDLAGADSYTSNAVGSQGYGGFGGFGALVDLAGDDSYTGSTFAQGAGQVAGAGFLVDASGNDVYEVSMQGQGFGQDAGGGFLSDGAGTDSYHGLVYSQGSGFSVNVVGLLLDGSGDDTYSCTGVIDSSDSILPVNAPRPGSICHAAGFGGTGVLVDGQGNDLYTTVSSFQAMTLIGTGILVDSGGADQFLAGEWSNGLAVLGASVLVEGAGDTVYSSTETVGPWADIFVGSNGEGYLGAGILADAAGNDAYTSTVMHGIGLIQYACGAGCTYTGGAGILIDGAGNDQYVTERGEGGSQGGIALLLDASGDDTYTLTISPEDVRTIGQGGADADPVVIVLLPVGAANCAYSALDDLDGSDSYSNPTVSWGARANDEYWGENDYGRGMDGSSGNAGYLGSQHLLSDVDALVANTACYGGGLPTP
jgi:hypothetical protein